MPIKNGVILNVVKDLLFVSIGTTTPHCKYVANFGDRTLGGVIKLAIGLRRECFYRRGMGQRRYGLRDDQWERIKDLLPGRVGTEGRPARDNRLFVEAVLYRYRAGIPWR